MENFKSHFAKLNYYIPTEDAGPSKVKKGMPQPPPPKEYQRVLEKVTLGNIHILNKKKDESSTEKRK
jgi:hypothetical protein